MKISRSGILSALFVCLFPTSRIAVCYGAEETPATKPVHNVLRDGVKTATQTERATNALAVGPTKVDPDDDGPSLGGPVLGGPVLAKPQPAVTKEVTTKSAGSGPKTAAPADPPTKAPHNALRDAGGETSGSSEKLRPGEKSTPAALAPPAVNDAKPLIAPGAASPKAAVATPKATTAVISDTPAAQTPPDRRPNALFNPGDEEGGKRAEIGKQPADTQSKKLFESSGSAKLTPEMETLRKRVQTTLATFYHNWTLNTQEHSPWEVMHAIIAYGVDTRLRHQGQNTTAIGHLCFSGVANNLPIVTLRNDNLYVLRGPGVQGHSGQFLAILAQSHLQRDYPLYVGGKQFILEDLIEAEKLDCESGTELTFKLIGLMHYLQGDATWKNFQGQDWSIDRLVREEIVQPIRGAACGGTHRLMGLSYAVAKREQRGQPISGIYKEAEKYIEQYHKYTLGLQNPDGSFSTAWFVRREARLDLDRRLQTTGHVLEWLCFSLTDEELRDPRIVRSVKYVSDLLLDEKDHSWEVGHLGHALHALQLYNERVFGGPMRSYEGLVLRRTIKTAQKTAPDDSTDGRFHGPFTR